jgi:hypothetical protein
MYEYVVLVTRSNYVRVRVTGADAPHKARAAVMGLYPCSEVLPTEYRVNRDSDGLRIVVVQ